MTPFKNDDSVDYRLKFQDALLSNSALTDGLTDDEAEPLIDWAMRQADFVAPTITGEVDADDKLQVLNRLVLFINHFTQRHKKHENDEEWFAEQFDKMDEASEGLGGPTLDPVMKEKLQNATHLEHTEVLKMLMAAYSSETATRPYPRSTVVPDTEPHMDADELYDKYHDEFGDDFSDANT